VSATVTAVNETAGTGGALLLLQTGLRSLVVSDPASALPTRMGSADGLTTGFLSAADHRGSAEAYLLLYRPTNTHLEDMTGGELMNDCVVLSLIVWSARWTWSAPYVIQAFTPHRLGSGWDPGRSGVLRR
jgi:hypothetical protein